MSSEPRYVTLPQLFHGNLFRVPDYQRGYAWTKPQLDNLWGDIELLDPRTQHFTGMVVVEKRGPDKYNDAEMQPYRVLEVIDGQQRLTTIVILMHAIVRELAGLGPDPAEQAGRLLRAYVGADGWRRLSLNDDSRTYFDHLLGQGEPLVVVENASQRNIRDAVTYFRDHIAGFGEGAQRLAGIRDLVARLQSNLRFVLYEVADDAEAGLIFEVMNNRGKPLSEADRLKNYLMYLAFKVGLSEEAVKGVASSWGDVFKQVMRSAEDGATTAEDENRLLRNHWILYREAEAPKELRGLSISQRVRHDLLLVPVPEAQVKARNERLAADALRYVGSLVTTAHDFAEVMNPDLPGALAWVRDEGLREDIRSELHSFHRMGHLATALPVILAGRRRLEAHPAVFRDLLHALSLYAFRVYAICDHRSHAGLNHFRRQARALFDAKPSAAKATGEAVVEEVVRWAYYYGGDAELEKKLRAKNYYGEHSPLETRYFFFEYEIELCHGQQPSLDWAAFADSKTTQVEHIWAQAVEWLGGDKKTHEANVNRLGNLTVSHFNQTLGRKLFNDKKPIYAKSSLVIEHTLQHHRVWSTNKIDAREDELVAFAVRRWKLPPRAVDDE